MRFGCQVLTRSHFHKAPARPWEGLRCKGKLRRMHSIICVLPSISPQGSFFFLKREIPTRLAGMIMELRLLPPDLLKQKECTEVLNDYIASFRFSNTVFSILPQYKENTTFAQNNHLNFIILKSFCCNGFGFY